MRESGHASPAATLTVFITFTCLAVVAVILRLYSRLMLVKNAGADDLFITFAGLLTIGMTVAQCGEVHYGSGRHVWEVSQHDLTQALKPLWISILLYNLALFCLKWSILLQYLRLFPHQTVRRLCYALMTFVTLCSCWTIFSAIFSCVPVQGFWLTNIKSRCLSHALVWFTNAGLNIVSDSALAILPLPYLRQLHLPKRQKIALMVVFALGGFTCIVAILRLYSIYAATHTDDPTWDSPLVAIWSSVEVNTGILCGCIPTLRILVTQFFPRAFEIATRVSAITSLFPTPNSRRNTLCSFVPSTVGGRDSPPHKVVIEGPDGGGRGASVSAASFESQMVMTPQTEDRIHVFTVLEQKIEDNPNANTEEDNTTDQAVEEVETPSVDSDLERQFCFYVPEK